MVPLDTVAFLAPSLPLPAHPFGQRAFQALAKQQVVSRPSRSLTVVSQAAKTEERTNTPLPPGLRHVTRSLLSLTTGRVHVANQINRLAVV